jgi:putative hemolysin
MGTIIGDDRDAALFCNFIAVHDCGDLWNTDTGNDTCGTDRTRSDTNFNCISSGINQCLCSSTGCNVSGDNLQIRVFCLDLLYGFQNVFGMTVCGIATGILTFLILIFGEVTPKTMATIKADSMSLTVAAPIGLLMKILTPVIFIINKLSLGLMFLLHVNIKDAQKKMTEEELRTIVDVSQENGVIEHEERDMIHNLFDFGDAEAKEIMVPRIDMTFVQADATYQEVLDIFRQDMFTRLPVYEDSTDNVIGIINMKDFLLQNDTPEFSVRNLLREPYFTYEHKNTADLFLEMRKSSISLAIVLDEYGVTAGLITLEDLLEEIVGEIRDEYDADEEDDITRISDREFYVLGSANLNDVSEALSLHFTSDDYDTIGGYCLGLLDHLPEKNEIILTDNNILLRIDRMEKNRIERIYIRLPEPLEETGSEQKSEE